METTVYESDLSLIADAAAARAEENDHFIRYLKYHEAEDIYPVVHGLTREVSDAIDCTTCGNCCKSLMINITPEEAEGLAVHLDRPVTEVTEQYIEVSLGGQMIINTIPCHFLKEKKCSIYAHRFRECRDFPHLHKPDFKKRLPFTLMYYGTCPIIYNVVEGLKERVRFFHEELF